MFTLAILCSFLSTWGLFSLSNKVEFEKKGFTLSLSKNAKAAKTVALVSFLVSTLFFVLGFDVAVGITISIIIWMIMTSLIVLFAPFPKLTYYYLLGLVGLFVLAEVAFHLVF
ncbi:MAG: hypothetical protein AAGF96_15175 [Bacteroidota bacterium]